MVILGTVFVALYGSSPNPISSLRMLVIGFLLAAVCAGLCYTLLPQIDGFVLLCVTLSPFLIVGSYMLTRPALASIGAGFNILFVDAVGIRQIMVYDWAGFLNDVVADLSCVVLALVMLAVFMPADSRWLRERMMLGLRRYAVATCSAPLPGLRARFETAPRDLLQKLLNQPGSSAQAIALTLQWAQLVMNAGRGVLDIREQLQAIALPSALREQLGGLMLTRVADLFERPNTETYARATSALATAERAIGESLADEPMLRRQLLAQLHLLQAQLHDTADALIHAPALSS
jgi:uncharacterized membrane protein YccC